MSYDQEQLLLLATMAPKGESTKSEVHKKSVRIHDLMDDDCSQIIEAPWTVGDIAFDKRGNQLAVVSSDGIYVFVYSVIYRQTEPILKYCRASNPVSLTMPF